MGRWGALGMGIGAVAGGVWIGREWDDDAERESTIGKGAAAIEEWSGRIGRSKARIAYLFDYFNKPAWSELLPPPLPAPHQRPYTLIVSLDDLLVTSTWDRQHGWRTAKRPGVDYFLGYLSQFYEIVVFTTQASYTAIPVLEKLDPFTIYIPYKLFRESTKTTSEGLVKDLSYLNRDLSKVVALDTDASRYSMHPENAIIVPKWKGDASGDRPDGLIRLIPFLESIAMHSPSDVRPILKHYAGKDIAATYAEKEAEQKRIVVEQWEKQRAAAGTVGGVLSSSLGGVFGASSGASGANPPLTFLERRRQEAQAAYKEDQAYWKANEEEFKRLMKEDQERQMKEMAGGSLLGWLGMGGPMAGIQPPPGQEGTQAPKP